jgi:hypothetical protein
MSLLPCGIGGGEEDAQGGGKRTNVEVEEEDVDCEAFSVLGWSNDDDEEDEEVEEDGLDEAALLLLLLLLNEADINDAACTADSIAASAGDS